jgi:23S rRNA (uridine2552-2'-O)-methyltransferase
MAPYQPKDHYFKKAKAENYAARSVYKLQEIDDKHHILQPKQHILDLGAAPGSWSQYAAQRIGPHGALLGIDLQPISIQLPNAHFLIGDILAPEFDAMLNAAIVPPPYQVVLSDMAPKTTGIRVTDQARSFELCEMALQVALQYLQPGGHFVCKMFDNNEAKSFQTKLQQHFDKAAIVRPKSTRQVSTEIFFVALRRYNANP